MNSNSKQKCPNNECNGDITVKYYSNISGLDKINFNCTTDSYSKPTILQCKKCEIIFSEFIYKFNNNQILKNYEEVEDLKYISQIKYKKIYFENFCKKIKNELKLDHNILEIGSYYGVLGSVIKNKVKTYSGLELSKHGSNYARKNFNLKIYNETIEEHLKKNIKYDLIIMADVIEHFNNPFQDFKNITDLLNKNGKIILTTFNIESLYAKITGIKYHWILPFHLVYFSNKTLKNLGKSNSLKLFKIENDPRYVSLGYLLEKLILIFPKISFLFKVLHKVRFFRNFSIKVNLGDLNIYYFIREK